MSDSNRSSQSGSSDLPYETPTGPSPEPTVLSEDQSGSAGMEKTGNKRRLRPFRSLREGGRMSLPKFLKKSSSLPHGSKLQGDSENNLGEVQYEGSETVTDDVTDSNPSSPLPSTGSSTSTTPTVAVETSKVDKKKKSKSKTSAFVRKLAKMRPGAKSKSKGNEKNDEYVIADEKAPNEEGVVFGEKREEGEGQAEGVSEDIPPPLPVVPPPTESEEEQELVVSGVGKEAEHSEDGEAEATQLSSVQTAMSDGGDASAGKEPGRKYRSPRGKQRTGSSKQLTKVAEAAAAGLKAAEEAGVVKEAISSATTTVIAPITPPKTPEEEKSATEFFKSPESQVQKPQKDKLLEPEVRTPDDSRTISVGSSQVSTPGTEEQPPPPPPVGGEEETTAESEQLAPEFPSEIIMGGEQSERREHLYKILVIGELGTGKTSIIKRYVHQFFSQHYRATIGVDFALKVLNWDANTIIRLQLWDIAGQERFGNMTRVYYKEAVGAFIVFDVTRTATFEAVVKWKQDLDLKVQLPDGSPIPCVLLANKCDQPKEGIVNNAARMEEYCKEHGFCGWFETSAKENINIDEAARYLVSKILQSDKWSHSESAKDAEKIALESRGGSAEGRKEKSCSC